MLRQLGHMTDRITAVEIAFQPTLPSVDQAAVSRLPRSAAYRPERADMNDTVIRAQYSTGLSRSDIEQALIAAERTSTASNPQTSLRSRTSTPWVASPPANWSTRSADAPNCLRRAQCCNLCRCQSPGGGAALLGRPVETTLRIIDSPRRAEPIHLMHHHRRI